MQPSSSGLGIKCAAHITKHQHLVGAMCAVLCGERCVLCCVGSEVYCAVLCGERCVRCCVGSEVYCAVLCGERSVRCN
jgi:hypothetical protein